jgi:hypothetical protein
MLGVARAWITDSEATSRRRICIYSTFLLSGGKGRCGGVVSTLALRPSRDSNETLVFSEFHVKRAASAEVKLCHVKPRDSPPLVFFLLASGHPLCTYGSLPTFYKIRPPVAL